MATIQNARDVILQAAVARLVTLTLPANIVLGPGSVDTPMIVDNAVTVPVSINHGLKTGDGTYQTLVSSVITLKVASIIQAIFVCVQGYTGAAPITRFRISHNGQTSNFLYDSGNNAALNTNPAICIKAYGIDGVNTFEVQWYAATSDAAVNQGALFLTGLLK